MAFSALFLDVNAFFASVEQQDRPELRGRPTVVVPVVADTTCCIAVSYEARPYGIKTGTLVHEARRLCPPLTVVEARPALYVDYHRRIVEAVETCLPVHAVHSIDEVSCRLMDNERERRTVVTIALGIKTAISTQIGSSIRCSIGIAPNGFLAKVASDMQKPDGLVMIESHELPNRLFGLVLEDLPGIGRRMLPRFRRAGILSVEQLCALAPRAMAKIWGGITGERFWYALHGYDLMDLPTHRRTVGHSHVLPPAWRTREGAHAVLTRLIHKASARMRSLGYWARKLAVHVVFPGGKRWSAYTHLGVCQDTLTALEGFAKLWSRCPPGTPLRVGVVLFDLLADSFAPLPLFPEEYKRLRLSRMMDRINALFGRQAVYFGGMFRAEDTAPMRIAFTQIPDPRFVG